MNLNGLHHVTAITGDARANLDFYTRILGLRLTAKSVNQDGAPVYHLFYGDERAQPGADLTFFEYPGATPGRPGAGVVHRVVWRVASAEALVFWADRLEQERVPVTDGPDSLRFQDSEGLGHELLIDHSGDEPLIAEHPEIPAEMALLGFDGVRAYSRHDGATAAVLERLLGAQPVGTDRWEVRGPTRGAWLQLDAPPEAPARPSAGTIHHVAWHTTDADQPAWLERLEAAGVPNSGIIDRYYFHSLYFREPGGILFELATEEPGFTFDRPLEELGREVVLPPWLESRRAEVEAALTPLPDPRAGWAAR